MVSLKQMIMHTIKTMAGVPMDLENKAVTEPWGAVQLF